MANSNALCQIIKSNDNSNIILPLRAGHWRLRRITLAEREEQRKRDRDLEKAAKKKDSAVAAVAVKDEEEVVDRNPNFVKYTLGVKHQVSDDVS